MKNATTISHVSSEEIRAEIRQIREAAQRIAGSKKAAVRFLASTKMYTHDGRLKPQFR
jgi:hypothetical protein